LCFSKQNPAGPRSLLDARLGLTLTVHVSSFFRDHNTALFEAFSDDPSEHPQARLAAAFSLKMSDQFAAVEEYAQ
jgi:hypothetical protein